MRQEITGRGTGAAADVRDALIDAVGQATPPWQRLDLLNADVLDPDGSRRAEWNRRAAFYRGGFAWWIIAGACCIYFASERLGWQTLIPAGALIWPGLYSAPFTAGAGRAVEAWLKGVMRPWVGRRPPLRIYAVAALGLLWWPLGPRLIPALAAVGYVLLVNRIIAAF